MKTDFEQSIARARAALLAKGVEAAASADINRLAVLAEKHGTGAYNQTANGSERSPDEAWDKAFAELGIKTKRSGGQRASTATTGARPWKEIMAEIEGRSA